MHIREESDGTKFVGKVLRLFCCLIKGEIEGEKFVCVRYMEHVPSLDYVDETLGCIVVCSGRLLVLRKKGTM